MKQIIEVSNEGLEGLMGETVTFFCMNYFYTGKLVAVDETCVKLESPKIIYETGEWNADEWKIAKSLPGDIYIQLSAVESFGVMK